jgi:hypothetical protein
LPAIVLKAIRDAIIIAIKDTAMVNLSESANKLPSSFRKESGVPIVACFPIMVWSVDESAEIFV